MVKCETLLHLLNSATCNSENFTRKALIYCDEDHELNFSYSELFDAADKVCEVLCSIGFYPYFSYFEGVFSGTKIPRKCSKRTRTLVNPDKYQHRMHVS